MFKLRPIVFGLFVCCLTASASAVDITVTARNLNDNPNIPPIQNIRVTLLNAAGGAIVNQAPFAGPTGMIRIDEARALIAGNKTLTLIVQSDGREDAVINVLFGGANQNVTVILPVSSAPSYGAPTRCYRRCRLFRRCR